METEAAILKFVTDLGPAGLGVSVILVLWIKILNPMLKAMQEAHEKREAASQAIVLKAQSVIEGVIVKNTDVLTRVDLRLRDDEAQERQQRKAPTNNDHDDDQN